MLLHLGGGFAVDSRHLVMMTDLSRPLGAPCQTLLTGLAGKGRVRNLPGRAATLILYLDRGELQAVFSPIGLRTLRLRAQSPMTPWMSEGR